MKTLTIKTPEAVTGIGFDKLNYIKIPIHRNNANCTDRLNFIVGLTNSGTIFIEGGKLINTESGSEGESMNVNGGFARFAVSKLNYDKAYLYIPDAGIYALYPPFLNKGATTNSLMAYIKLSDLKELEVFDANGAGDLPPQTIFSFTIVDSLTNLSQLKNLRILRILCDQWITHTPVIKLNENLDLPALEIFAINQMGNGLEIDSICVVGSTLLTVFELGRYSSATIHLSHFSNKPNLGYFIVRNSAGVQSIIEDHIHDISQNVSNVFMIEAARFNNGYTSATWKNSILHVSMNVTNFSPVDGDKLLTDLNKLSNAARRVDIPTRTTASNAVVSEMESRGWVVVVWNGVV